MTAKSLASGLVAHRGIIQPSALTVVHFLSEGPELFYNGVQNALNNPRLSLAPPPELGFYKTEGDRAIALARSLIASAAESVGEPTDLLLPEWPHSEHANYTRDALIGAARRRRRAGELAQVKRSMWRMSEE